MSKYQMRMDRYWDQLLEDDFDLATKVNQRKKKEQQKKEDDLINKEELMEEDNKETTMEEINERLKRIEETLALLVTKADLEAILISSKEKEKDKGFPVWSASENSVFGIDEMNMKKPFQQIPNLFSKKFDKDEKESSSPFGLSSTFASSSPFGLSSTFAPSSSTTKESSTSKNSDEETRPFTFATSSKAYSSSPSSGFDFAKYPRGGVPRQDCCGTGPCLSFC